MAMLFAGHAEPPPWLSVVRSSALDLAVEVSIIGVEAEPRELVHTCSTASVVSRGDNKMGPARIGRPPSSSELVHALSACIDGCNLSGARGEATL